MRKQEALGISLFLLAVAQLSSREFTQKGLV